MEAGTMIRTLLRLILILLIVVALGAFFFGYRWGGGRLTTSAERPIGTTGTEHSTGTTRPAGGIDTARARAAGAEIGEKVAVGASRAEVAVAEASLTTKIKSKMVLDDTIEASRINVDTNGTLVTLTGDVDSAAQKARALQLARETDGVTSVVNRITVGHRQ
jgi:hypothetical protein